MNLVLADIMHRPEGFRTPRWMPTYLPSVAGALRDKGHAVAVVERGAFERRHGRGSAAFFRAVERVFRDSRPQAILFDVFFDDVAMLGPMADAARRSAPDTLLLAGGRHPTSAPEETLEFFPMLDGVVIGDPENVMLSIAGGARLPDVPALMTRAGGKTVCIGREFPVGNLDDLPFPAWDLFDMDFYTRRTSRIIPCIPLKTVTFETSRGCGGACTFCTEGRVHSRTLLHHSPDYVRSAIEKLIRDYGIEAVYFCDESFLGNMKRVRELCEELAKSGLHRRVKWNAQVRTDSVTPEILADLRRAGCIQIEYGIESGSQRMLDSMAKGATVEQNAAAIRLTREAGIRSMANIIIGLPGETADDVDRTDKFLAANRPDALRINPFVSFPGTPATRRLIADGVLARDFWRPSPDTLMRPNVSSMSSEALSKAYRRLYFRHLFPLHARDYLKHNGPTDFFAQFEVVPLFNFLLKKASGRWVNRDW
jgi:radical SAM superfamily enzyme YgiQ (UPF0313 family)